MSSEHDRFDDEIDALLKALQESLSGMDEAAEKEVGPEEDLLGREWVLKMNGTELLNLLMACSTGSIVVEEMKGAVRDGLKVSARMTMGMLGVVLAGNMVFDTIFRETGTNPNELIAKLTDQLTGK